MVVIAHPFWRSKGPLAAPPQMLLETVSNVRVNLPKRHARIAEREVVRPAFQVPVQLLNQLREWFKTLPMICHLVQLGPLSFQRLGRREHIQVPPRTSLQIVVIAERESQKVQTLPCGKATALALCRNKRLPPCLAQFHHSRFVPVDLQP